MNVSYDQEADALYVQFRQGEVTTQALSEDILADYDAEGHLAGIEVLNARRLLGMALNDKTVFEALGTSS